MRGALMRAPGRVPGVLPVLVLLFALAGVHGLAMAAAGGEPQAALERHLADEVPYWLEEPRLHEWLRQRNAETASLDTAAVAALSAQWQREVDAGSGPLTDRIASRFASKYLAEVVLRTDGAYRTVVVLDLRGLVAAADETPDQISWPEDPLLAQLAADPDAPWVQDGPAGATGVVRVAMPLTDPEGDQRSGTLLLVVDLARLATLPTLRQD